MYLLNLKQKYFFLTKRSYQYYIIFLLMILTSACSKVKPDEFEPVEPEPIKENFSFFNQALDKNKSGCIVYSVNKPKEKFFSNLDFDKKIITELKKYTQYKLEFVVEKNNKSQQMFAKKLSTHYHNDNDITNIFLGYAYGNDVNISPPYQDVCKDLSILYITKNKIQFVSKYRHRDEGVSAILFIHKK